MSTLLRRRWALVVGVALVLATSGVALAAGAALPLRNKVYDGVTGLGGKRVSLTLIVNRSRANRLVAGPLRPPLGSQYALSEGALPCPRAHRSATLLKGETPFALFGFPGAKLRLRGGHYTFSVKRVDRAQSVLGSSSARTFRLTIRLTGTVLSARTIEGTLRAVGGGCTTHQPLAWKVRLNRKLKPPPGT